MTDRLTADFTPNTTVDINALHGRARQSARRLAKRKQRVALGEMLPRMRQATKYRATHVSAYTLPDAPVKISKKDADNARPFQTLGASATVRPYYPRIRRVVPAHERPSECVTTKMS